MLQERKNAMNDMRIRLQKEYATIVDGLQMNSDLKGDIFFLLKNRVDNIGARSFFVHSVANYVKEVAKAEGVPLKEFPEKLFDTQLPFLAEGIITVQYYENQILDGKGGLLQNGVLDRAKVNRNVIAGHFVKDFLYRYIDEQIFPDDCTSYRLTMKKVHQIFQAVDLGQAFQARWGTFEAYQTNHKHIPTCKEFDDLIDKEIISTYWEAIEKRGISKEKEAFVRNYLRRIYLTSTSLFLLFAELVMDLLDYQGKKRENILKFATSIGINGQIVNDIHDFVPARCGMATVSKTPEDAFADLRNDNITLPLVFYFNHNPEKSLGCLQKYFRKPEILLQEVGESIALTQKAALKFAKISNQFLAESSVNEHKTEKSLLLQDMNSIASAESNRFYKKLEESICQPVNPKQRQVRPQGFLQTLKEYSKRYKCAKDYKDRILLFLGFLILHGIPTMPIKWVNLSLKPVRGLNFSKTKGVQLFFTSRTGKF